MAEDATALAMGRWRRRLLRRPTHGAQARILAALVLLLLLAVLAGVGIGAVPVLGALLGGAELTDLQRTVLLEIRVPRVLLAGLVGAALGMSGAVLQGLFRNPLAEPQLIGVSGGAALGAIGMIVLGASLGLPASLEPFALPLAAFCGAALVTSVLYGLSTRRGGFGIATLLLVGVAINALTAVGIGGFTYLADDGQLRTLTFWTMGSFGGAAWTGVLPVAALILGALAVLVPLGRQLDILQLGETESRHLGVDVAALKRRAVFASAAAVGAGVAVSGIIGFIGLVVPHVARLLGGVHHGYLLPASAALGAALAILADLGARTLIVPAELPVGLLTSAIGAPFFLWLIMRVRAR